MGLLKGLSALSAFEPLRAQLFMTASWLDERDAPAEFVSEGWLIYGVS